MKKQIILVAIFSIVLFGFGSVNSALAIVNQPIDITSLGDEVGASLMASSDLGVDDVGILPTSPFYFLKEWKRGITRFFTFGSIAKVRFEFDTNNHIAAEVLEVEKSKPDDAEALRKALENFTDAQERLNMRIGILLDSTTPFAAKILEEVDEKTALHVALLEQLAEKNTDQVRFEVVGDSLKKAQDNTLKTFTVTVTPINDAPTLKQKAEDQIKRAGVAISEANSTMQEVSTARGMWRPSTDDESNIFDRWSNSIIKAKGNLENAKKAFAEGKYGEAYGQARSAEAMVAGIGTILNDDSEVSPKAIIVPVNGDTTQEPDETFSTKKESPKIESPKPSPKPSVSPTTKPTPEKTETPDSAGSPLR